MRDHFSDFICILIKELVLKHKHLKFILISSSNNNELLQKYFNLNTITLKTNHRLIGPENMPCHENIWRWRFKAKVKLLRYICWTTFECKFSLGYGRSISTQSTSLVFEIRETDFFRNFLNWHGELIVPNKLS